MRHLSFLALLLAALAPAAETRPNILFFFADDWGRLARINAEHGNLAGTNGLLRTPNLDRLAKEGVRFRNAHVNAPSCTPCRSSLLSGQHFWRAGRGRELWSRTRGGAGALPAFEGRALAGRGWWGRG